MIRPLGDQGFLEPRPGSAPRIQTDRSCALPRLGRSGIGGLVQDPRDIGGEFQLHHRLVPERQREEISFLDEPDSKPCGETPVLQGVDHPTRNPSTRRNVAHQTTGLGSRGDTAHKVEPPAVEEPPRGQRYGPANLAFPVVANPQISKESKSRLRVRQVTGGSEVPAVQTEALLRRTCRHGEMGATSGHLVALDRPNEDPVCLHLSALYTSSPVYS